MTKEQKKVYDRKRYWVNPEASREKGRKKISGWRKRNPTKNKELKKIFYERNPNARSQHQKKYLNNHREEVKSAMRKWYVLNSNRVRDYRLKYMYGITPDDYNEMFSSQEGRCQICLVHQSELKQNLYVDHDHISGTVRALLCGKCNGGLGMFRDDIGLLKRAVSYLENNII